MSENNYHSGVNPFAYNSLRPVSPAEAIREPCLTPEDVKVVNRALCNYWTPNMKIDGVEVKRDLLMFSDIIIQEYRKAGWSVEDDGLYLVFRPKGETCNTPN